MKYPNTLGLPPLSTEEIDRIGDRIDAGALVDDDVVRLFDSHVALTDRLAHANQEIAALQDTIAEAERLDVDRAQRIAEMQQQIDRYRGSRTEYGIAIGSLYLLDAAAAADLGAKFKRIGEALRIATKLGHRPGVAVSSDCAFIRISVSADVEAAHPCRSCGRGAYHSWDDTCSNCESDPNAAPVAAQEEA